jgi:hypothetical protein
MSIKWTRHRQFLLALCACSSKGGGRDARDHRFHFEIDPRNRSRAVTLLEVDFRCRMGRIKHCIHCLHRVVVSRNHVLTRHLDYNDAEIPRAPFL